MADFMLPRTISAGALAVAYKGRLVLARGYTNSDTPGDVTQPTSLFRIASLTKPITATAIMVLVQQNRLALDTPVVNILNLAPPPGRVADARLRSVTVRHLLSHLGGWDRDLVADPTFNDAAIARALGVSFPLTAAHIMTYATGQPLQHDPGTTFAYANYGYILLGEIIERVSGQSYEQFVLQRVLMPMGLHRLRLGRSALAGRALGEVTYRSLFTRASVLDTSGATVPFPYGGFNLEYQRAQGGWIGSAVDLARFASTFDAPDASPVLTAPSVEAMFAQPSIGPQPDGRWYGLGWFVRPARSSRNTWHDGSLPGTSTWLVRRWDGVSWAVLFNQREDPRDQTGRTYSRIDDDLHFAADQVASWPDHDLFQQYLPPLDKTVLLPVVQR